MDLAHWDAKAAASRDRHIMVIQDSTANFPDENNNWPEKVREMLSPVWGYGGESFIGCWDNKIIFSGGGWNVPLSDGTNTDPYQVFLWPEIRTASGAVNIATRTLRDPIPEMGGVVLWVIDYTSAANFSYDWDNAGTWTNTAIILTAPATAAVKRFFVPAPASGAFTNFRIRAANAAGTAVRVYLGGMEFVRPRNERSYGAPGPLRDLTISNLGNSADFMSNVMKGTGTTNSLYVFLLSQAFLGKPVDVCTACFTNDGVFNYSNTQFNTLWDKLKGILDTFGVDLIAFSYWGQNAREQQQGDAYFDRQWSAQLKAWTSLNNVPYFDLREIYGDFDTIAAKGLNFDDLHPNGYGTQAIANAIVPYLIKPARNAASVPWLPKTTSGVTETFFDDFELGNTSKWVTVTGAPPVSSTSAKSGGFGVRLQPALSDKSLGTSTTKWTQTGRPYFSFTGAFRIVTAASGTDKTVSLVTIQNLLQVVNVDLFVDNSTGRLFLDLQGPTEILDTGITPIVNRWYTIKIRGYFGGPRYWTALQIDGIDFPALFSNTDAAPSSTRALRLGPTGITTQTWTADLDDIKIQVDNQEIGWIS